MSEQKSSQSSQKQEHRYSYPPYYLGTMEGPMPIMALPGVLYESLERGYAPSVIESQQTLITLRRKLRWSRPMMAAFLGVSRQVVRHWETGSRKPSGAARRLIWLMMILICDRQKLQTGLDLIFWGRADEIRAFNAAMAAQAGGKSYELHEILGQMTE